MLVSDIYESIVAGTKIVLSRYPDDKPLFEGIDYDMPSDFMKRTVVHFEPLCYSLRIEVY